MSQVISTIEAKDNQDARNRVLVTGARGFLGQTILRLLDELEIESVSTSRRHDEKMLLPRFVPVDLCDDEYPAEIFDGVEQVIHTAGLAHQFGKKGDDAVAFFALNADATERMIKAAVAAGVKHFVHVSSVAVYGPNEGGDDVRDEKSVCNPVGHYAISKFEGERRAIEAAKNSPIRLTVLRMTTIYGEGDRGNTDRLMKAIDRGRFVEIGAGENLKSLIHIRDAATACVAVLNQVDFERPVAESPINVYNVSAKPVKMNQVSGGLARALGKKKSGFYLPAWMVSSAATVLSALCLGKGPFGRIRKTIKKWLRSDVIDASKFCERFSFTPEVSLDEGLGLQVKHYRRDSQQHDRRGDSKLKRAFDFCFAAVLLVVFAIPMAICALAVRLTSKGPAIHWSKRMGKDGQEFQMAKFRSMFTDTPNVPTHMLTDAKSFITPIGRIMRKTSLDELPQLWNVIKGEMSFVGPRPALVTQNTVNDLRADWRIQHLMPGITGWAQINGRDELRCEEKVEYDRQYFERWSFMFDLKIILMTVYKVFARDGVRQADEEGRVQPPIVFRESEANDPISIVATTAGLTSASMAAEELARQNVPVRLIGIRSDEQLNHPQLASLLGEQCLLVVRDGVQSDHNLQLETLVLENDVEPDQRDRHREADLIFSQIQSLGSDVSRGRGQVNTHV